MSIQENQPRAAGAGAGGLLELATDSVTQAVIRWLEAYARDGCHIAILPVFEARGREAHLGKRLHTFAAEIAQPLWDSRSLPLFEISIVLQIKFFGFFQCGRHQSIIPFSLACYARSLAGTVSSSQLYPFSSSSRASSLPPDFTIRPLESTCTKSGTM